MGKEFIVIRHTLDTDTNFGQTLECCILLSYDVMLEELY